MSLCLVAWCPNGIAICADSRSSFPDATSGNFHVATDSTEKLFQVGRTAVVTSGFNSLVDTTIHVHMGEFSKAFRDEPPSVVADAVARHFLELYKSHVAKYPQQRVAKNRPVLDFLVGGYEGDEPACFMVRVIEQEPGDKLEFTTQRGPVVVENGIGVWRQDGLFNFSWIGDGDVVQSLINGYNKAVVGNNPALSVLARPVPVGALSLQDCVDLLYFLCQASERMKHFSAGDGTKFGVNRTIGGPIDVAVVRKSTGFASVKKKELGVRPQLDQAPTVLDVP